MSGNPDLVLSVSSRQQPKAIATPMYATLIFISSFLSTNPRNLSSPWYLEVQPGQHPLSETEVRERTEHERQRMAYVASRQKRKRKDEDESQVKKVRTEPQSIYLSTQEIQDLRERISTGNFSHTSIDLIQAVHHEVSNEYAMGMDHFVCAVCDRLVGRNLIRHIPIQSNQPFIKSIQGKLTATNEYHPDLLSQYSISHPLLEGLLLSPDGVNFDSLGRTAITLNSCHECQQSIMNKKTDLPPRFSIANGFAIGKLPQSLWDQSTHVEFRCTSLITVAASRLVISGGPHGQLRGHVHLYDNNATTVCQKLPRLFNSGTDGIFHVVFASSYVDRPKLLQLTKHLTNLARMRELLGYYFKWNPLYRKVHYDPQNAENYKNGLPADVSLVADYDPVEKAKEDSEGPATTEAQQEVLNTDEPMDAMDVLYFRVVIISNCPCP
jgi:hypothetical protein